MCGSLDLLHLIRLRCQWNEEFWFDAHVGVDFVAFDLFDHDTLSKDENLGSVSVSKAEIASLQKGVEKSYELTLTGVKKGKLYVSTSRSMEHNLCYSFHVAVMLSS